MTRRVQSDAPSGMMGLADMFGWLRKFAARARAPAFGVVLLALIVWTCGPAARAETETESEAAPQAETQTETESETAGPDPEPRPGAVDRSHASVGSGLIRVIESIDRFFVDDNFAATTNESFVRLAPGLRIREGPHFSFKPRVQANFQLPRTQRRLGLVLSGREQEDDPLDGGMEEDSGFGAGLRAVLFDDTATKVRLSAGSRFRPEPDPFVRLRAQRVDVVGSFAIRPSVTGFWELDQGLGERNRLDIDTLLGPRSLLRLRGEATYGESTAGVELRTSLTHFFALTENSAWMLQLKLDSETRPSTRVVEYRGLVRYRWSMVREWLFFEVEPGVRFRRSENFGAEPEAIFRIEVVFGSLGRLGMFDARGGERPRAMLPRSAPSTSSSSRVSGRPPSRRR